MEPLLRIADLVKHFPLKGTGHHVHAVNGISFSINKGETLSLVGEFGSGKTTVGRCVLGLIRPTSGEALFRGKPIGSAWNVRSPALRGKIQLVFQEAGELLDPRMSIWASIEEPLRQMKLARDKRQARVREVIERVNLPPSVLDQYPFRARRG